MSKDYVKPESKDFELFFAPAMVRIGANVDADALGKERTIKVARGERASVQLLVSLKRGNIYGDINLSFANLESDNGGLIGKGCVSAYYVEEVKFAEPAEEDAKYDSTPFKIDQKLVYKSLPDRLSPLNEKRYAYKGVIAMGENEALLSFWINIDTPSDTLPGIYEGAVTVSLSVEAIQKTKLKLEVVDAELPLVPSLKVTVGNIRPEPTDYETFIDTAMMVAKYKMSLRRFYWKEADASFSAGPYMGLSEPEVRFEGDEPVIDFSEFERTCELLFNEMGMGFVQFPHAYVIEAHGAITSNLFGKLECFPNETTSDEFRRKYKNTIKRIADFLREKGWLDRFFVNFFDEPYREHYGQVKEIAGLINEACPELRPMCLGLMPQKELEGVCVDHLVSSGRPDYDHEYRLARGKAGDRFGVYNPRDFLITLPLAYPRTLPWLAWLQRWDYLLQWCLLPICEREYYPQTFSFSTYHYWCYEGKKKGTMVPSVRLEMFRKGLEDYEYFVMLRDKTLALLEKLSLSETEFDSNSIPDEYASLIVVGAETKNRLIGKRINEYDVLERVIDAARDEALLIDRTPCILMKLKKEDGRVFAEGFTEDGSKLFIDGEPVLRNCDGSFNIELRGVREYKPIAVKCVKGEAKKEFIRFFRNSSFDEERREREVIKGEFRDD